MKCFPQTRARDEQHQSLRVPTYYNQHYLQQTRQGWETREGGGVGGLVMLMEDRKGTADVCREGDGDYQLPKYKTFKGRKCCLHCTSDMFIFNIYAKCLPSCSLRSHLRFGYGYSNHLVKVQQETVLSDQLGWKCDPEWQNHSLIRKCHSMRRGDGNERQVGGADEVLTVRH